MAACCQGSQWTLGPQTQEDWQQNLPGLVTRTPVFYPSTQRCFGTPKVVVGFLAGFWAIFVSLGMLEEINQPWEDQLIGDFWGIRTTLDYNFLSFHFYSVNFHCSLKWQPLSPIWTYNLFAQFHSQTASKIIWIKICWLCPTGLSQWPYQGRGKRVGFWLLCAYF